MNIATVLSDIFSAGFFRSGAPRPGALRVRETIVSDRDELAAALTGLAVTGGWVLTTDALHPWPPPDGAMSFPILEAELCGVESSWRIQHQGESRWSLLQLERTTGGSGDVLLSETQLLRGGRTAHYEVHWGPGDDGILAPLAHRLLTIEGE